MTTIESKRETPTMLSRTMPLPERLLLVAAFTAACMVTALLPAPACAMPSGFNPGTVVANVMENLPPGAGFGFAGVTPLYNSTALPAHPHRRKPRHD